MCHGMCFFGFLFWALLGDLCWVNFGARLLCDFWFALLGFMIGTLLCSLDCKILECGLWALR